MAQPFIWNKCFLHVDCLPNRTHFLYKWLIPRTRFERRKKQLGKSLLIFPTLIKKLWIYCFTYSNLLFYCCCWFIVDLGKSERVSAFYCHWHDWIKWCSVSYTDLLFLNNKCYFSEWCPTDKLEQWDISIKERDAAQYICQYINYQSSTPLSTRILTVMVNRDRGPQPRDIRDKLYCC